jgi:shikimate dehydrogenase
MKCFAVIGNPIAHSRSPAIHEAFAAQLGIELQYERVLAPLNDFAGTLQRLQAEGFAGCNVTLPFKVDALACAQPTSERAQLAGAANTLGWAGASIWADNTDGLGLRRDIEHNAGWPIAGRRVLILGAGGASAGCLGPLLEARPARVAIWNRSSDKAVALVERHRALATQHRVELSALPLIAGEFDAVINGTSAALGGQALVLPTGLLQAVGLALDMVYGTAADPFLHWAQAQGAALRLDGLGMLVEQAAEAFALWHGQRPDTAPVLAQMRRATP